MLAVRTFRLPTRPRSCSTSTGWAKVTRTICPPTKSTPRLSPRTPTTTRLATVTSIDSASARLRQRMKSRFVLSGTSFSSRILTSDIEHARPLPPHPEGHQHSRKIDSSKDRGDDSDHEDDREAPDRSGAEVPHQHGRD